MAPDADLTRQWDVVDAFITASRRGDIEALLTVLDPDVVLRLDRGAATAPPSREVRGAQSVIGLGFRFGDSGWLARPGPLQRRSRAGRDLRREAVLRRGLQGGRIVAIDILADPKRVSQLGLEGIV